MKKREISFIGSGNIAWHLAKAFDKAGHTISQVISKTESHAFELAKQFGAHYSTNLHSVYDSVDICLICVGDDDVEDVVNGLPNIKACVAHTCGPRSMDVLANKFSKCGVFYPLQSFTKHRELDMWQVPVMLEASGNDAYQLLNELADSISNNVSDVNSENRLKYHLSAVLVNNFVNHLYQSSSDYLKSNSLDFKNLLPIIRETAAKLSDLSPEDAQTGPAKRGDDHTLERHVEMLHSDPGLQEVYRLMSERIRHHFGDV